MKMVRHDHLFNQNVAKRTYIDLTHNVVGDTTIAVGSHPATNGLTENASHAIGVDDHLVSADSGIIVSGRTHMASTHSQRMPCRYA